jgi:two-component system, OmpR family, phosphate regulon sensor histidine kinase PhoR
VIRFRSPAIVQLRRAQLVLMLAALVPTALMTALGILLLVLAGGTSAVVIGVLVLALCTSSLTGYILGSIFVSRGASVARFQNDFLSSVSHEIRTPLTSILMFIETLRDQRLEDPAEQRKCLDLLDREVRRLQRLVERLVDLSRIEAGRHDFDRRPVEVRGIVDDALVALEAANLGDSVEIDVDLEDDLLVTGDREALAQAVANLLTNAWKYTPEDDKRVALRARGGPRHVEISVADNGPGIPRHEQRQIFDRFERGKAAIDSRRSGSGLGLAIVLAIINAHRGKLTVHSEPGEGAEFRIRLRRTQPEAALQ